MADSMPCPVCGYVVRGGKHPKDGSPVEVLPLLVGHLNSTHQREIAERLARGKKEEAPQVHGDGTGLRREG